MAKLTTKNLRAERLSPSFVPFCPLLSLLRRLLSPSVPPLSPSVPPLSPSVPPLSPSVPSGLCPSFVPCWVVWLKFLGCGMDTLEGTHGLSSSGTLGSLLGRLAQILGVRHGHLRRDPQFKQVWYSRIPAGPFGSNSWGAAWTP
jgi:hypothetical protein